MRLPLTLLPKPSRLLRAAVVCGHSLAAAALAATKIDDWAIGLAWLLIAASLAYALRRMRLEQPLALVLRGDGRIDIEWPDGRRQEAMVGKDTVVLPWMVVLASEYDGSKHFLTLPGDALDPEAQRSLRLWLRWRVRTAAAPSS